MAETAGGIPKLNKFRLLGEAWGLRRPSLIVKYYDGLTQAKFEAVLRRKGRIDVAL